MKRVYTEAVSYYNSEFVSATKQQLTTKKELASTVDVNLRSSLLLLLALYSDQHY